jgi:hypothetical protein
MAMTARSRLVLAVGLAAVGAAGLVAIGIWTAREVREPSREVIATPVPWYDWIIDTPAPTPTRTPLSICIESDTPANPALVYAALDEVEAKLERWAEEPRGRYDDATVVAGCPEEMLRRPSGFVYQWPRLDQYQMFISLLSPEEFGARFGDRLFAHRKERFCQGHVCAQEVTGMYVPSLDQKNLFEGIVNGFGLLSAMFYWTPTPQPYTPTS